MDKISLTNLYQGLACYRHGIRYKSPKEYIKPILDKLSDKNYTLKIYVKRGVESNVYDQVLVQVIFDSDKHIKNALCFAYALDIANPIFKLYQEYFYGDYGFCDKTTTLYLTLNDLKLDYSMVDFMLEFKEFNIDPYHNIYKFNTMLNNIGHMMYKCMSTTISYDDKNIVSLSGTVFVKLIKTLIDKPTKNIDLMSIYMILYKNAIHNDLINQFEKLLILNNSIK